MRTHQARRVAHGLVGQVLELFAYEVNALMQTETADRDNEAYQVRTCVAKTCG